MVRTQHFHCEGPGSIPGGGARILQAARPKKKKNYIQGDRLLIGYFSKNYFIYFWLRRVFVAARRLSVVAESGDYSSLRCAGSRHVGFSSCGSQAQ